MLFESFVFGCRGIVLLITQVPVLIEHSPVEMNSHADISLTYVKRNGIALILLRILFERMGVREVTSQFFS